MTASSREHIRSVLYGMLDESIALPRSIWHHIRMRHLELASQIAGRTPIYLDSRLWFDLRLAEERRSKQPYAVPLLVALRDGVKQGKIFCPISSSTFLELLKHDDRDVRIRTAQLTDELSLGIAVASPQHLAESELEWLLLSTGDHAVDPCRVPVWTKVTSSLGSLVPEQREMPPQIMLALQIATFDEIWHTSLEEVARRSSNIPDFGSIEAAVRLTEGNRIHAHEVIDFETVYCSEVIGSADLYAQMFSDILRHKAENEGIILDAKSYPEDLRMFRNTIGQIQLSGKKRQALRSFHIRASLYAIIRLNKGRRFKPNDLFDIEHAAAGVGYCRAFFSEKSLVSTLTQRPLKLNEIYSCYITSDFDQAVRFVKDV